MSQRSLETSELPKKHQFKKKNRKEKLTVLASSEYGFHSKHAHRVCVQRQARAHTQPFNNLFQSE